MKIYYFIEYVISFSLNKYLGKISIEYRML